MSSRNMWLWSLERLETVDVFDVSTQKLRSNHSTLNVAVQQLEHSYVKEHRLQLFQQSLQPTHCNSNHSKLYTTISHFHLLILFIVKPASLPEVPKYIQKTCVKTARWASHVK